MITSKERKKINFMVDLEMVNDLQEWIAPGERSDFVNKALEEAMRRYKREKACEKIIELRNKTNIRISTAELIKRKNYGRP